MSARRLIDDCFLHDRDRLRHEDALSLLRERLTPVVGTEAVAVADSLSRVVSEDVHAPHDVPLHTNAAVDGYAFDGTITVRSAVPVAQRIAAGDLSPAKLAFGSAARIFTGAVMPPGADTVAMQEDCEETDGKVNIPAPLKPGANCRKAGEDIKSGEKVLSAGTRLGPADLAAAASIGCTSLPVFQRLKITYFSSGNELRRIGGTTHQLRPGEVYDTNWPMIASLLAPLSMELHDGGVLGDNAAQTQDAIAKAAAKNHVIITTGGASRGTEDHMLDTLDALGKRHLWQLAVKPGRPMMFGQITRPAGQSDCLFFGLPGNPVAAMVCFLLYTRPALLRLAGAGWSEPWRYSVPAAFTIRDKKPDRREFLRGILRNDENGRLIADKFARDGSGLISSLRQSHGLIEIPEEVTDLEAGNLVDFIPFCAFD